MRVLSLSVSAVACATVFASQISCGGEVALTPSQPAATAGDSSPVKPPSEETGTHDAGVDDDRIRGLAVAVTDDAMFVVVSATFECHDPDGDVCTVGRGPCSCSYASDGALVRYEAPSFAQPPTTIATGFSFHGPHAKLAIVDGHAIVVDAGTQSAVVVSLKDGSLGVSTPVGTRAGGVPFASDGRAVYVEKQAARGTELVRITPSAVTSLSATPPDGLWLSPFFAADNGSLYFPADCATKDSSGTTVGTCARSGIQRASIDGSIDGGGVTEHVLTVGESVENVAVREQDIYFAVGQQVRRATVGSTSPPIKIFEGSLSFMGLTATDGGVFASTAGSVMFIPRDMSAPRLALSTGPDVCGSAQRSRELIA